MFAVLDQVGATGHVLIGVYSTQALAMDAVRSLCTGTRAHLVTVCLDEAVDHARDCISCNSNVHSEPCVESSIQAASKTRTDFMRDAAARATYMFAATLNSVDTESSDDESIPDLVQLS
jgi:hypothetical protein